MRKDSVPERYGMVICPVCNGKGFLIESSRRSDNFSRSACAKCGGFGAIRKEEEVLRSPEN
jgi:DnaJ-class molecular chaperone